MGLSLDVGIIIFVTILVVGLGEIYTHLILYGGIPEVPVFNDILYVAIE